MQTTVHAYRFDLKKPEDAAAYAELSERLKKGPSRMKSHGGERTHDSIGQQFDGKVVELETDFLFENQWNTVPAEGSKNGYRLFDWAEDALYYSTGAPNKNTRQGYWLEQTPEMREIRRNTNVCGYCGKYQPAANGAVFCDKCIDSPYLRVENLPLLRLRAVDERWKESPALTEAESAYLMPLYRSAQLNGSTERGKARLAKIRSDVEKKFKRETANAKMEHDGFIWLCDHGLTGLLDNCIFYSHSENFCFGWRNPVDDEAKSAILNVISEFPYPYEIKCADGKTLAAV